MPRKKEVVSGNFVKYDAVVLGSGPAGEGAAMKLAKAGKRVAIVDVRDQLGGNCAHVGTIPSKALRQTVSSIIRYQRDPMFQKVGEWKQFTMKQVLRNAHKVIQQQVFHSVEGVSKRQYNLIGIIGDDLVDTSTQNIEKTASVYFEFTTSTVIFDLGKQ